MADNKEVVQDQEVVDASAYFDSITGDSPTKDADDGFEAEKTLDQADTDTKDDTDEDDTRDDKGHHQEPTADKPAVPEQTGEEDPFAGASESQRQYLEQLKLEQARAQNAVRASAGKISALTKQLNELMKAKENPAAQNPTVKLEGKSFEEVERDWPELAEYVRAHVVEAVKVARAGVQQELEPIRGTFQQMTEREQREQILREREALASAHPDFPDINRSYEFENWLRQQPESIAMLRTSMRAADNIKLLNLYKAETGRWQNPAAAPAPQRAKPDLSAHAELPRKAGGKPETLPDDPEDYFNYITQKKKR